MHVVKSFQIVAAHPWDRQPRETPKSYECFKTYLDLGIHRSQRETAEKHKKVLCQIQEWADKYRWLDRAMEYDNWLETSRHDAKRDVIAEQAELWQRRKQDECEESYNVATRLRMKALEMLDSPLYVEEREKSGVLTQVKPAKWNLGTCATMFKLAAELAMMAISEAQDTGDAFDPLTASPEECRAYLNVVLDRRKAMKSLGETG